MVLSIENYPLFYALEVIQKLGTMCSCKLSPRETEPYNIVLKFQIHNHTETSKKVMDQLCADLTFHVLNALKRI